MCKLSTGVVLYVAVAVLSAVLCITSSFRSSVFEAFSKIMAEYSIMGLTMDL